MTAPATLVEVAALVGGQVVGDPGTVVSGLAVEPERVVPGDLFADYEGGAGDWDRARRRGARARLVETPEALLDGRPGIVVDDARVAAGHLAARFLGYPARRMQVVAVTGTNGKTTVHWLTSKLLGRFGLPSLRLGTLGIEVDGCFREEYPGPEGPSSVTLNRTLRRAADAGVAHACIEATSRSLAERRWSGIDLDVGIFMNLTRDHLDYHRTMDAYFGAKCRLFDVLEASGKSPRTAVVCVDDPLGRSLAERLRLRDLTLVTFGVAADADLVIHGYRLAGDGSSFELRQAGEAHVITTPTVGAHNAHNMAASFAAACALGFPPDDVADGLGRLDLPPGRLQTVGDRGRDGFGTYVDYAHSPAALATVLTALRPVTRGRLWVVFGCGGDRDRGKRPLMLDAALAHADRVVVTSDNPRHEDPMAIIDDVLAGGTPHLVEPDRRTAIHQAVASLEPGDVLVVAGKGHERDQIVGDTTLPFSDADEIQSAVARRRSGSGGAGEDLVHQLGQAGDHGVA